MTEDAVVSIARTYAGTGRIVDLCREWFNQRAEIEALTKTLATHTQRDDCDSVPAGSVRAGL